VIVRDAKTGEPTGVLKDAAQGFVWKVIPASTFEEKLAAARAATNHAASLGVTSVQDMSAGADVGVYQTLLDRGDLKTRIYAVWPLPGWDRLARTGVRAHFGSAMLRNGGLKGFADGSLGSTTALFYEPYRDAPNTSGIPSDEMFPEGGMLERIRGADKAGLQILIHAIGDKANDLILSMYEQVRAGNRRSRSAFSHRACAALARAGHPALCARQSDRIHAALSRDSTMAVGLRSASARNARRQLTLFVHCSTPESRWHSERIGRSRRSIRCCLCMPR
jgi:predicted amidohydrolase YtcJ